MEAQFIFLKKIRQSEHTNTKKRTNLTTSHFSCFSRPISIYHKMYNFHELVYRTVLKHVHVLTMSCTRAPKNILIRRRRGDETTFQSIKFLLFFILFHFLTYTTEQMCTLMSSIGHISNT